MNRRALKRIPLHKLMDLKVDFAFKQLFGSEKNKDITVVFLNAILKKTGRHYVKEILFIDKEIGGEHDGDKQSRLDIVVKTQNEEIINIEMQLSNKYDMLKRTLYYWSRLYVSQLAKGEGYHKLAPTITINICDFTQMMHTDAYHTTYHLYDDESFSRLERNDDVLEIHFIEMKKFLKAWHEERLNPLEDILARWLLLLGMVDARKNKVYDNIYTELEELAMKDEHLLEAFTIWENLSTSPKAKFEYESRIKAILDEEAMLKDAQHKGVLAGFEQGRAQGVELAMKDIIAQGVKNNVDIETLAVITNYSIEKVKAIIEETQNK